MTQKQQLNADDDENLDEVDEDNDNQNRRNIWLVKASILIKVLLLIHFF